MTFSRRLALFIGTITPAMELLRRRHELTTPSALPFWIDDLLLGAFLLYGAWRVRKDPPTGQPFLAAAWAFMLGLTYYSFFGQLQQLRPDPSGARLPVLSWHCTAGQREASKEFGDAFNSPRSSGKFDREDARPPSTHLSGEDG